VRSGRVREVLVRAKEGDAWSCWNAFAVTEGFQGQLLRLGTEARSVEER
jgi:hypothetical protein